MKDDKYYFPKQGFGLKSIDVEYVLAHREKYLESLLLSDLILLHKFIQTKTVPQNAQLAFMAQREIVGHDVVTNEIFRQEKGPIDYTGQHVISIYEFEERFSK